MLRRIPLGYEDGHGGGVVRVVVGSPQSLKEHLSGQDF